MSVNSNQNEYNYEIKNKKEKFDVDEIMSKCKYIGDNFSFNYIQDIWENKFGAIFNSLSENTSMLILKEDSIPKLQTAKMIPVDCRIFALLYASLKKDGCSIIMQKNEKGIEIMIPDNCYYMSLSNKININKDIKNNKTYELKSALDDSQGQWLTKIDDRYIGIVKEGILKMSLNEWFEYFAKNALNIITNYDKSKKYDMNDFGKNSRMGLLKINIQKYGFIMSLYNYGNMGEINVIKEYAESIPENINL